MEMIIAIIGAMLGLISLCIFVMGAHENLDLKPTFILMILAIGLSMNDPIFLVPLGKIIVNLPWVGIP
jgi:hypothetical protein